MQQMTYKSPQSRRIVYYTSAVFAIRFAKFAILRAHILYPYIIYIPLKKDDSSSQGVLKRPIIRLVQNTPSHTSAKVHSL